ncbi:hypothetical protein N234_25630 [Ralstonia pickettii DTP0602]|nr:hypothetical protein N234_25630 [Ralstonia pickettii DTP0602]
MVPYHDHAPPLTAASSGLNALNMEILCFPKQIRFGQIFRHTRFNRDVLEICQMAFESFNKSFT